MKRRSRPGGEPIKQRRRKAAKPIRRNASEAVARSNSSFTSEETEVARLTRELSETREQHAASADVLKVISRSTFNLQIVLDTLVQSAARLCEADTASLVRPQGSVFQQLASYGYSQELNKFMKTHPVYLGRGTVTGRTVVEGKTVQIPDVLADAEFTFTESVKIGGMRTMLGVPLLRDGVPIGVIMLSRRTVRPFSDKQVELVKTFADQAVIAIENTRVLNELRQRTTDLTARTADLTEALERQTATSEVLQVISSSPGDLQPVFEAMLQNAVGICNAGFGQIHRWNGDALMIVATHNTPSAFAELRNNSPLLRPSAKNPLGRVINTKTLVYVHDCAELEAYAEGDPPTVAAVEVGGIRSSLIVPMLKEDELVGLFALARQEVRPFTEKQIELVQNFAAQAVIAIENARLLNELRQSLERQTAASQVLQVISSSTGDLEHVFATMLENAIRICEAKFGALYLIEGDGFRAAAMHNAPLAYEEARAGVVHPPPSSSLWRAANTKEAFQIADVMLERGYVERDPFVVSAVAHGGYRSVLSVPMLHEDKLVGVITIFRQEVCPFGDKQIELVKNCAAQAVRAIENARLLNELRGALERQTATSEVLQVISGSPGDLEPVFAAMLESAVRTCGANFGNIYRVEGDGLSNVATHNTPTAFTEALRGSPYFSPGPNNPVRRMMQTKTIVHVLDVAASEAYAEREPITVASVELSQTSTLMIVPMLKDNELAGAFTLARQEVRPFTDKQIELVQNFAARAVIAIENARLLNELRQRTTDLTERTADLTEALEQQTATSEVLQVISSSPGDLQPVFAAMLEKAVRICDATFGDVYRPHEDAIQLVAMQNTPPAFAEALKETPHFRPSSSVGLRMVATKSAVQVIDLAADQDYIERRSPFIVAAVELGGVRTVLAVPMLKENELIGAFMLCRQEVRPFTDKQIELVKNFAAQAVIAIENARLLNELRQSLEQQTATSEVLEVISSSPGDLEPVFATMLEKAVAICDAKFGNIHRWDGEALHLVATHNTPPAFAEARQRSPNRPNPKSSVGRMIATKTVVHVADVAEQPGYSEERDPASVAAVELGGVRTVLYVPMLKDNELVGAFTLSRQEVRPFSEEQIGLIKSFAAQAVVAIENARLLKELRETTEEVQKLNQQLERRVTDQVDEIERMSRLRRFLPPQVADLIVASGSEKQLESHRREITALFCDLRGFTGFTEAADAEDVMALLREYHAAIGEKIVRYSGTLERYAGDGVMVVFNDPVPVENPALQAVLMALEMRDAIGALTSKWRRFGHDIGFGIGIAHGFATLGTIGFEGRFDYAAIGTVSNVASRLCDEAKPGQILISPRVLVAVEKAVQVEPVGEFELKGIRRPLAAYNVVGLGSPAGE
jgi:GAF domain-containing protein